MLRPFLVTLALACTSTACSNATGSSATAAQTSQPQAARPAAAQAPQHDSLVDAADRGRILGKESAPVWFLVVSDFQCPYCKAWHDSTFHAIESEYVATGKIRMAYLNYPIPQHVNAIPAAVTAMCASAQGKFWPLLDRLFDTQNSWKDLAKPRPFLDSLAALSGANLPALRACEDSNRMLSLIEADQSRFQRAGVQGTPTFFVGSAQIVGALPLGEFRHVIDSVVAAAHKSK